MTGNNQQVHVIAPVRSESDLAKITSNDSALEQYLLTQVSLNDQGVYYESDCSVCSSPSRHEVEEMWLVSRNADEVTDILKSRGEPTPLTVVKNHMEFHIDQSYIELRKREYIKKLVQLSKMHLDTIGRVELALACMHQQMVAMGAAEDPTMSQLELNRKRSDSMCRLVTSMTSLLNLRATILGEMQAHGEAFVISNEDFEKIFTEALQTHVHVEARKAINDLLSKFMNVAKKQ